MPQLAIMAGMSMVQGVQKGIAGYNAQKQPNKSIKMLDRLQEETKSLQTDRWDKYKEYYRPTEQKLLADANMMTPTDYSAVTGVSNEAGRLLEGMGSSNQVGQSGFLAEVGNVTNTLGTRQAGAEYSASRNARSEMLDRKHQALSLGKYIPEQQKQLLALRSGVLGDIQQTQSQYAQGLAKSALGGPGKMLESYGKGQKLGDSISNYFKEPAATMSISKNEEFGPS